MNTDTQIIILAGGKGTRMNAKVPKALVPVKEKPMIHYVVDTVEEFTSQKPITVVGYSAHLVEKSLGERSFFALQEEQKGTGHAVQCAQDLITSSSADTLIILYADQPFVSAETLKKLSKKQRETTGPLVIATAVIEDGDLFKNQFYNFGRIIRGKDGVIVSITEKKDANPEELLIKEVNPAYFCVDKKWALECLSQLDNNNAQGEYYLTDLVKMAFDQGHVIESVQINQREALGANTREQLEILESFC